MTLSTFLGKDHSYINEREHVSFHPPWKDSGSKSKNPQSALSALTLLAFLFFLNMLQSCLRDSLQSQAPITIMMTTTTTTTETEGQRHKRSNGDIIIKEYSSHNNEESLVRARINEFNDQIEMSNSKDIAVAKYNNIHDYNIFILEENMPFNNKKTSNKTEQQNATKEREMKDSTLSNWIYDKACCKCESKHKKTKKKNSKGYLRVGISLVCEFIYAISIQGKCMNDNKCKINLSKRSIGDKDKSILTDQN